MYDSEGKRKARDLVIAVAQRSGCETFLDFWGGGESARQATAAGLAVTSVEKDTRLGEAMVQDGVRNGYKTYVGDAVDVDGEFDFVFADFCGNANPSRFVELRAIAAKSRRWLAVTLAPDWQMDSVMQGPAATFTVPAWIIGATGMRLAYLTRYVRNESGTTMWMAILHVREDTGLAYDPVTVDRCVNGPRRYWASKAIDSSLLPYRQITPRREWSPALWLPRTRTCAWCRDEFTTTPRSSSKRHRFCSPRCCRLKAAHPRLNALSKTTCPCGREFTPQKFGVQVYCSRRCTARYHGRRKAGGADYDPSAPFGRGVCPRDAVTFVKTRRDQKYCRDRCRYVESSARARQRQKNGLGEGSRTLGLLAPNEALCLLSYAQARGGRGRDRTRAGSRPTTT